MIINKFQLRFKDRLAAAILLAEALDDRIRKNERYDTLILGIARAGVITADIVASRLSISNFNIIIPRKLRMPSSTEDGIGAIMDDGTIYLDRPLIKNSNISREYLENERLIQIREIKRRKGKSVV